MRKFTNFNLFDKDIQNLIKIVAAEAGVVDYQNVFSSYKATYTNSKLTCYLIMRLRGFSTTEIGLKFKKDHSTIVRQLKKAEDMTACYDIARKVNLKLKCNERINEKLICSDVYKNKEMFENIKLMMNRKLSILEICNRLNLTEPIANKFIGKIRATSKKKKIPDYKKSECHEIFL